MTGIIASGIGAGMMIMPPVASWLIASYGWRTAYIIIGIIAMVFTISAAQFLKRDPAQIGQLPDGEEAKVSHLDLAGGGFSFVEAIHTRQFWMLCAISLFIIFCVETILVHSVPNAVDLGISATNAANILAIIGGASIVGRFVTGSAGDRIGNKSAIIVCFVLLSAALLWLQVAKELQMFYLFAVIYGFAHGGFFALVSPIVAQLFGLRSHGAILGVVLFSGTVGGAIGPVLAGKIFDVTGSYQIAFSVCVAFSVIGLILASLLKPTNKRGNG